MIHDLDLFCTHHPNFGDNLGAVILLVGVIWLFKKLVAG